jgi:hypothetical protein
MYITEKTTEKTLTITVHIDHISRDAANTDELASLMRLVHSLCIEAAALDAALRRMIAPF